MLLLHPVQTSDLQTGRSTAPRFSPYQPSLPHLIATPTQQIYRFLMTGFEIAHLYLSRRRLLFETANLTAQLLSAADLDLVIQLNEICNDFFLFQNGLPPSVDDAREFFDQVPPQCDRAQKLPIGVFRSKRLVGVIDVLRGYRTSSDWYIGFLLLAPSFRGQGFGTELHNEFVSYARRECTHRLLLAVLEENDAARRFWLRLGYRKVKDYPPKPYGNRSHACAEFEMVL